jgi:2-methylisocitrate lyase-like PEP mutase family enzyme
LPVNIMMKPGVPSVKKLAELGVARVSHGPFPYMSLMDVLKEKAHSEISKL